MSARFGCLLDMLHEAFSSGLSEPQYHNIVHCLRHYTSHRIARGDEEKTLKNKGWPASYHPCDHMENIRWGMHFGTPNPNIEQLLDEYKV